MKAFAVCLAAASVVFVQGVIPAAAQDAQGAPDYIVTFRAGTDAPARARAVGNAGASVRFAFRGVAAAAVRVPSPAALAALQRDPAVAAIVPDRKVTAFQSAGAG